MHSQFLHREVFTQSRFFHKEALLYILAAEIAAPKPDLGAKAKKGQFWSTFWKEFWKENRQRQHNKKKSRQITIATLMQPRFTTPSCKRQNYYMPSRSSKKPWRSHYTEICKDGVAKQ